MNRNKVRHACLTEIYELKIYQMIVFLLYA